MKPGVSATFLLFGVGKAAFAQPSARAMFTDGLTAALCPVNDRSRASCFWSDYESVRIASVAGPAVPAFVKTASDTTSAGIFGSKDPTALDLRPALAVHVKFEFGNCSRSASLALHSLPGQILKAVSGGSLASMLGQINPLFAKASMSAVGLGQAPAVYQTCVPYIHLAVAADSLSAYQVRVNHHTKCTWVQAQKRIVVKHVKMDYELTPDAGHAGKAVHRQQPHHSYCRHFIDVLGEHECECRSWLPLGKTWAPTPAPTAPPTPAPTALATAAPTPAPPAPTPAATAQPTAERDLFTRAPTKDPNVIQWWKDDKLKAQAQAQGVQNAAVSAAQAAATP